jgi:DNA topoisomerase-3
MSGIVDFTQKTVEKIMEIDPGKLKMQRAELGPCPRCAAAGRDEIIRENARAFGCTSWKSREETGCGFVIWRTIAGRQLMPEEAKELIEDRITSQELHGFRSKAGKPFRAKLKLNDEDKVEFVFDGPPKGPRGRGASDESGDGDSGAESVASGETETESEAPAEQEVPVSG